MDESKTVAMQICSRLPKNEMDSESMIRTGYELARNMSWDIVVDNYLLRGLKSVCKAAQNDHVPDKLHVS
jgi:hypothetical protein